MYEDRRAFDCLVLKYQAQVRRFFINQTMGDTQLSDDLAQDTFIKAYNNIGKFKSMSSFGTWLYRIAYNVFYDHVHRNKLTEDIDTKAVTTRSSDNVDSGMTMDINKALAILSDNERSCVTLQLMEGQSIDKIAEITKMAEGTIKSHLSRGKQKLATYLKQNGYGG